MILFCKRAFYRYRNRFKHDARESFYLLDNAWKHNIFSNKQQCSNTEFLVVDTETSSLNPSKGELLSIGWVVIRNLNISLDTAEHFIVTPKKSVEQSATIHHLRDCDLQDGISKKEMIIKLISMSTNRVLVFHHATLDISFLNEIFIGICGAPLLLNFVDTLQIEKTKLERQHIQLEQKSLTLNQCRRRYHLPDYPAHNALIDALSTAELLLAQITHKGNSIQLNALKN
ncbi:MAG: exonuclease domain-containing protein [Cellvibrionaceae bacterium]